MSLWLKFTCRFKYEDDQFSSFGAFHGECSIRVYLMFCRRQLIAKLQRKPLLITDYVPKKPNFHGWPESYYGKRLSIQVLRIKINGFL